MMNSSSLKTSTVLTIAAGAGVALGVAGVLLYEHFFKTKRRLILQQEVLRLGLSVNELRRELEEQREAQTARRRRRRANAEEHNTTASVSESEMDMMSIIDDEDEFFDFSDTEDYSRKNKKSPDEYNMKIISAVDVNPHVTHSEVKPMTTTTTRPPNRRVTTVSNAGSIRNHKSTMSMGTIKNVGRMRTLSAVVSRDWHDLRRDSPENKNYKLIDDKLSNPDLSVKIEAYDELTKLRNFNQNDPDVLWRLAKVCHGIGVIKGLTDGLDVKKTYIDEAVTHATDCLELAPRSAEAHKWYAITIGSRGEFQPTKNKIKDGFVFKEHIEEGLKISPDDPTLLHLLGRFRYEVATLSWVERKVANTVFGEVPYSTFPEALEPLLRVEELNKDPWKENRLMIAKCYINMGQPSDAVVWLDKAFAVESRSMEEMKMHTEIQELLEKYERYRNKEKQKTKKT